MAHENSKSTPTDGFSASADQHARMIAVGETTVLMSHRINNIVQGINGGSHLVELGLKKDDLALVAKGWQTVNRNQAELTDLISKLMLIGKPIELIRIPVDVVAVTQQTVVRLSEYLQLAEVTVHVQTHPAKLNAYADAEAVGLAIENLIRVAVRACRQEAVRQIEIRFEKTGPDAFVRLHYEGAKICLNPAELANPASPDDRIVGGIEFALCRRIVCAHHGQIVVSRGPGANWISISLPIQADARPVD